jgi:hypothetical protein
MTDTIFYAIVVSMFSVVLLWCIGCLIASHGYKKREEEYFKTKVLKMLNNLTEG